MFNITFSTKNATAFNETIPEIFTQQLYSSEQRWEGITAQVYQALPPKGLLNQQFDGDGIVLHLHGSVDLQRRWRPQIQEQQGAFQELMPTAQFLKR